jgi:hypothetical protein
MEILQKSTIQKINIEIANTCRSIIKENKILVALKVSRNLEHLGLTNENSSFEILRNDNKDLYLLG